MVKAPTTWKAGHSRRFERRGLGAKEKGSFLGAGFVFYGDVLILDE